MKLIRHMTKSEYIDLVQPSILKVKALFRKKFFHHELNGRGFDYLTADEYIQSRAKKSKALFLSALENCDISKEDSDRLLSESLHKTQQESLQELEHFKIKQTSKMPEGHYEEVTNLLSELKVLFSTPRIVDWSKIHKDHKQEVRFALDYNFYILDLLSGVLEIEQLEKICESVNIRVPKRIYNFTNKPDAQSSKNKRIFIKKNKQFVEMIESALQPFSDTLKSTMAYNLKKIHSEYLEAGSPELIKYADNISIQDFKYLISIVNNGFDDACQTICENYVRDISATFLYRLHNKLGKVNAKYGSPSVSINNVTFHSGEVEAVLTFTYTNFAINASTKMITASGEVQRLHNRYLSDFYIDGKKVSQDYLDNI